MTAECKATRVGEARAPRLGRSLAAALWACAALTPPAAWAGPTFTTLYRFAGQQGNVLDGAIPVGVLIMDNNGVLYGTTSLGGGTPDCPAGCGTVFLLAPPAKPGATWTERVIWRFGGETVGDGSGPLGGLILDGQGSLYGTTGQGGNAGNENICNNFELAGCGTVFKLKPPGGGAIRAASAPWSESILYAFNGAPDGAFPWSDLIIHGGLLYGTTSDGGNAACPDFNTFGCGTVFSLTAGGVETVIYRFAGATTDGAFPYPGLAVDATGELLGVAQEGGTFDSGAVFKLSRVGNAWHESLAANNFYGYVFPTGPFGRLVRNGAGALFGTSQQGGGVGCFDEGCGTVFMLTPPKTAGGSWTSSVIYRFQGVPLVEESVISANLTTGAPGDGSGPRGTLAIDGHGNLYGTTLQGGLSQRCGGGCGTVFKLAPPAPGKVKWQETVLYRFTGQADGTTPSGGVMIDKSGTLYGTASEGGRGCAVGCGTVFEIKP